MKDKQSNAKIIGKGLLGLAGTALGGTLLLGGVLAAASLLAPASLPGAIFAGSLASVAGGVFSINRIARIGDWGTENVPSPQRKFIGVALGSVLFGAGVMTQIMGPGVAVPLAQALLHLPAAAMVAKPLAILGGLAGLVPGFFGLTKLCEACLDYQHDRREEKKPAIMARAAAIAPEGPAMTFSETMGSDFARVTRDARTDASAAPASQPAKAPKPS